MFDLSSKFNEFYKKHVVLPQNEQTNLFEKRDLNIERLKKGLEEYNKEHNTSYNVIESSVQGSLAMSTIIQNEKNDYDIDIAIVFNKDILGDKGAQATRNIVADALRRKTKQFSAEPEIKTSCVRVKYTDGYHIDFAIFRRSYSDLDNKYIYEHAGEDWNKRDLEGVAKWFKEQNNNSDENLRRVVRLSKMFCKSRDSWKNMPSGLIQTILCNEKLQSYYERIDEIFYYTMKEIVSRIEVYLDVNSPVDNGRALVNREIDRTRMINWKNRLKSKLEDLEVLFSDDCNKDDAMQAWYGFFNHDFWNESVSESMRYSLDSVVKSSRVFTDTEEYIEDKYPIALGNDTVTVSCNVSGDGFRPGPINKYLTLLHKFLPHNFTVYCSVEFTTVLEPYKILWKVKNVGPEAERRNAVRGQIMDRGPSIKENTLFFGNHYIECYIIKNGCCVARKRIDVPIGR